MPEELPAWCTWSMRSTQWYFSSATSSKPASRPMSANDGLSPARPSTLVSGRTSSSWSSTTTPLQVLDGRDRLGEVAVGPGLGGPVVRLGGVGVDVGARPALEGGDQVGADALRHEAGAQRGGGVGRPGAAVGAHRHPAHRLDAAGEDQVLEAGAYPGRRLVDGLEAARAEAVELDARDRLGEARRQRRGLGDVAALLADRRDDAEHDVVDPAGVEARVARLQLVEDADDEVDRLDLVEGADGLALAARRPDVVVHECFGRCVHHGGDCDTLTVMVVNDERCGGASHRPLIC